MKRVSLYTSIFLLTVFFLSSCSSVKINYSGKQTKPVKKIALVSSMIGLIDQPAFPLADAAIFNAKTNSIAKEIMQMQNNEIESCRAVSAKTLSDKYIVLFIILIPYIIILILLISKNNMTIRTVWI